MAHARVKTFVLLKNDGTQKKISVPETWRMTYGNLIPYMKKNGVPGETRIALRFYEGKGKDNLRAVFTDCAGVWDDVVTFDS